MGDTDHCPICGALVEHGDICSRTWQVKVTCTGCGEMLKVRYEEGYDETADDWRLFYWLEPVSQQSG